MPDSKESPMLRSAPMTRRHPMGQKPPRRPGFGWKVAVALIIILLLLPVLAIAFVGSAYFIGRATDWAEGKSGREIEIADITIQWRREPRLVLSGVKVGNPEWAKSEHFFEAERILVSIRPLDLLRGRLTLPQLEADKPRLWLEKTNEQNNWQFGDNPAALAVKGPIPEKRTEFPLIGELIIRDGELNYREDEKNVLTQAKFYTASGEANAREALHLEGKGQYDNKPMTLEVTGGSVLQLRDASEPYPFNVNTRVGDTSIKAQGTVDDPVNLAGLRVELNLQGANAADLFPLTGIALPPTPPYRVNGQLEREEEVWVFKDFKGTLGNSDLSGNVRWDPREEGGKGRPFFTGRFVSQNLDMADLSGLIGAKDQPKNDGRVIPDTPIDISRLMAMDADVTFQGKRVRAPELLDNFSMRVLLNDGVLKVQPVTFGLAKGTIDANITINGRQNPPVTTSDITFQRLSLEDLFAPLAKRYGEENVTAGLLGGKAKLRGRGKALRDILGSADGDIGLGMEGGQLSRLLLELVGLDIFKSAGLILSGDKPVPINCVVGDFGVSEGLMQSRVFLIDTGVTTINGEGTVNLKNEALQMRLNVTPKDSTLLSARSPILIGGVLKKPTVGIDPVALSARGGLAAVLGALLTPPAALLAFIEPSLGKESECAKFVNQLDNKTSGAIPREGDKPARKK